MVISKISRRFLLCAIFCVLGFLGNWFKVSLFFNVDFLWGSVFSTLAIATLGGACGIVAAFVAGTCTYFLWNHPWAIVIFTAEAVVVSWLYARRKGNLVIYDLVYWLCFGMPMVYLFYHLVMGMTFQSAFVVILKQSVNGVSNALLATIGLTLFKYVKKPAGIRISFSELLFVMMVSFALLPTILLSISAIRTYEKNGMETYQSKVSSISQIAQKNLAGWVNEYHNHVQILARFVGDPNTSPLEEIQRYVEIVSAATPALKGMGVFNNRSISVSYFPLEQDGKSNIGVDMSFRSHIPIMRKNQKPYITDMLTSKLGDPSPIVILLAPIIVTGEYKGYCSGVVKTSQLSGFLTNLKTQNMNITLVDGQNRVIVSTLPDFKTMDPFARPYLPPGGEVSGYQPILWQPESRPNTSLMQRWQSSYLFSSAAVSENCNWKLIVEASLLPLAEDISRYSLSRLTLQGLLIFTAIVLSYILSNGFITNVKKLQVLTRSVPEKLDETSQVEWPDSVVEELAELSNNFQQMTSALVKYIDGQKMTEDALRESQAKLEAALASMVDAVFISDSQGRFIHLNEAFATFHRFSSKDECLKTLVEYPDILDLFMDNGEHVPLDMWAVSRALRGETVTNTEYTLRRKDTGQTWVGSYSFAPIRDKEGVVVGSVVVGRDITERKYAEEALRQREEEFRALVENAPDVISLFDRNLRRIYVNSVVRENTGFDASFMMGKSLAEAGYPDSFARPLNAALQNVFATGLKEMVELDYEAPKPKGRIWLEIRLAPVRDANGSVLRVMTIGRNITDRKKAEIELYNAYQEKTVLLKEVHHRVKNNLQIVASLLSLQAGRSDNPQVLDMLQDTRNRVRSMALLHETLYHSGNLARINFASYLNTMCGQILSSVGPVAKRVELEFHVASVGLPLETALPCGLIVNELVSNALKHGFPGDLSGKVIIGLELVEEGKLALSVRDEGIGLPPDFNTASTATLGMRLVTGLVSQLDGQLKVETPRGGGVSFYAVFPLPVNTKVEGEA
jgi:two-component system, cell cycle sensor histidine kinase and response regulator CckA